MGIDFLENLHATHVLSDNTATDGDHCRLSFESHQKSITCLAHRNTCLTDARLHHALSHETGLQLLLAQLVKVLVAKIDQSNNSVCALFCIDLIMSTCRDLFQNDAASLRQKAGTVGRRGGESVSSFRIASSTPNDRPPKDAASRKSGCATRVGFHCGAFMSLDTGIGPEDHKAQGQNFAGVAA